MKQPNINMQRIAVLLGATGMVGGALLKLLLDDTDYDLIRVVGRRSTGITHSRLEEHVIDMSDMGALQQAIKGARVVFVAIGTTMRRVRGDRDLYRTIDFDIPVNAAKLAAAEGVAAYALVSAVGADPDNAYNFYIKLKGVTEETVAEQGVPRTIIVRPSLLMGQRMERRPAERVAQWLMPAINPLLRGKLSRYRGIDASDVARAMIRAVKAPAPGLFIYEYDDMIRLSRSADQ